MRIRRTDRNQQEIMDGFRDHGCSVQSLHTVGKGCPDLLVGFKGWTFLVEVKTANGEMTEDQVEWCEKWQTEIFLVSSLEDVDHVMQLIEHEIACWQMGRTANAIQTLLMTEVPPKKEQH